MKLKLGEIVAIQAELDKIARKSIEEKFPGFLAIKFARLLKDIEPFFNDFDKQRVELVQRLGKPDPSDANKVMIDTENVNTFNSELNKMLSIDIEFIPSISFNENDFDLIKIDVLEAMSLLPFIVNTNIPAANDAE